MRFLANLFGLGGKTAPPDSDPDGYEVVVPLNDLRMMLPHLEKQKGAPLTEEEVIAYRDSAVSIVLRASRRDPPLYGPEGMGFLDPENIWEEWQQYRAALLEGEAEEVLGRGSRSKLAHQIRQTLCDDMILPAPLERLFEWIEENGYFVDTESGRVGFLFSDVETRKGRTETGRPGGTQISFAAEEHANLESWFQTNDPQVIDRLCVFAKTGGDGSMAAFWLADDGSQKIVHLGSGSGSTNVCVLADDAVDFLRLLAIGYDEICCGDEFSEPPNAIGEFIVEPNRPFADWVAEEFSVNIPERGSEIVKHAASMDASLSPDPFWQWTRKHAG